MTDTIPNTVPTFDFAAFEAQRAATRALEETIRPANKAALFEVLASADITRVVVNFDGYGDSGQVEDIDAYAGDDRVDLPTAEIEIATVSWGQTEPHRQTLAIRDAIEALAYDFLESVAAGWENNEGAYGDFVFDVAEQTIELDYNERITRSESYSYDF